MADNKHAEAVEAVARVIADQIGVTLPSDLKLVREGEGYQGRVVSAAVAVLAALNTRPDVEAMKEACAAFLEDEARGYRHGQDAATSANDKLYRMGQKDACLLAATAIRSIPVPTSGEGT